MAMMPDFTLCRGSYWSMSEKSAFTTVNKNIYLQFTKINELIINYLTDSIRLFEINSECS